MRISQFAFSYGLACRILLKLKGQVIHMVRNLSSVQRVTLVELFGSLE